MSHPIHPPIDSIIMTYYQSMMAQMVIIQGLPQVTSKISFLSWLSSIAEALGSLYEVQTWSGVELHGFSLFHLLHFFLSTHYKNDRWTQVALSLYKYSYNNCNFGY